MRRHLRLACAAAALLLPAALSGQERVRVLLDTDAFNEIDDQFFIAYALKQPQFAIEGIAAAQYRWEQGSVDESYYEILRVLELAGVRPDFPVVRGSDTAMPDEKTPRPSEAVELIRRAALRKDARKLNVLAVGALTNVGSALVQYPEIVPRMRVIWLGGFPPHGRMNEFNVRNDRAAAKAVFESGVELVVAPTETCARMLTLTYPEAEARLKRSGLLGEYLLANLLEYGERNKVIWDIVTVAYLLDEIRGTKFIETATEPAAGVDLEKGVYIRGKGPHRITVCGKLDRKAIFDDVFRHFPQRPDTEPPYLLSALATDDGATVELGFSEPIQPAAAGMFRLNSQAAVRSATMSSDRSVRLALAAPLACSAQPAISAPGVKDLAGNAILPDRARAAVRCASGAARGLRLSIYAVPRGLHEIPAPQVEPLYRQPVSTLAWPTGLPPEAAVKGSALLLVAEGSLYVPLNHRYTFELKSNGPARVRLDGRLLLDQGGRTDRRASRTTVLDAGLYDIRIEQYVERGRPSFNFFWNLPFHEKSLVPDGHFTHR